MDLSLYTDIVCSCTNSGCMSYIANNNGHRVNSQDVEGGIVKLSSDSDSDCVTKISPTNM